MHKWRDSLRSCVRRISIVKTALVSKVICKLNVLPIKIRVAFPIEIEKINSTWIKDLKP